METTFDTKDGRRLPWGVWHRVGRVEIMPYPRSSWRIRLAGDTSKGKVVKKRTLASFTALEMALYTGEEPTGYAVFAFGPEALEAVPHVIPWFVIIWPDQYDDAADTGYGWEGEASSRDEAVRLACKECEKINEWEPDAVDPETVKVIEAQPDFLKIALNEFNAGAIVSEETRYALYVAGLAPKPES